MELNELLKRCVRILHISRKPTPAEYNKVAKVTALGMVVFGAIGLIVSAVFGLF
ncbi:MAG: protein translocase SEC61 complex subunit gamma [Candidatus Micrarchaeota archaeon]